MNAPGDLPFPHVSQAYLIERHVIALNGTPLSDVAALGVTSLDATRASPQATAEDHAALGLMALVVRDRRGPLSWRDWCHLATSQSLWMIAVIVSPPWRRPGKGG